MSTTWIVILSIIGYVMITGVVAALYDNRNEGDFGVMVGSLWPLFLALLPLMIILVITYSLFRKEK